MQRSIERRPRGGLPRRQARLDLVERERIVAEHLGVLVQIRQSRLRALVVARDRRRLTEARMPLVPQLDLDDLGLVLGAARDHERLRQAQRRDASLELHAAYLTDDPQC